MSPTFETPDPTVDLQRILLTYGPFFLAPGLWAYATYPDRLKWTGGIFARIFGLAAAFYDQWTNIQGYGDTLEEALTEIAIEPTSILDLATGTGFVARKLKQTYPMANVTGVDVAPEMVAIAQHEAAAHSLEIKFRVGDNSELHFEDETFDLVVMQNAFPFLDEMTRVLKPGGSTLIVWSFGGPWVAVAWPAMAKRLEEEGAAKTVGRRAGFGFYGIAVKEPPPLVASMRSK